ncbi:CinA-like protein [Mahella australiensis 50-1 BON]|uniref:CinA-like protein n=1 Tax=Mahella australiensis (strain DSM 15567 / CIP 107919 / 50-1 BON) TaxID=697281 RepID=F3ZXJ0_MAHA5|nr:CinA-like protein [Mahella australiensis 50-1 BON]
MIYAALWELSLTMQSCQPVQKPAWVSGKKIDEASFLCPDGFGVDNPTYAKYLIIKRQRMRISAIGQTLSFSEPMKVGEI